jgi:hypothetical protein
METEFLKMLQSRKISFGIAAPADRSAIDPETWVSLGLAVRNVLQDIRERRDQFSKIEFDAPLVLDRRRLA